MGAPTVDAWNSREKRFAMGFDGRQNVQKRRVFQAKRDSDFDISQHGLNLENTAEDIWRPSDYAGIDYTFDQYLNEHYGVMQDFPEKTPWVPYPPQTHSSWEDWVDAFSFERSKVGQGR